MTLSCIPAKDEDHPETAREALTAVLPILENLPEWNQEAIHAALFAEIEKLGVKTAGCCIRCAWPFPASNLPPAAA